MKHDTNFGLLRLLAACQVIYMHSVGNLGLPRGGLFEVLAQFPGVPVFFVISGFLVSDSWLRSATPGEFYLKRALRIYPALFVNIAILEAAVALTGTLAQLKDPAVYPVYFLVYALTASDWIASALTTAPWAWVPGFFKGYPSGVLWTLTVELSFYLILPLLLIRPGRIGLPLLMLGIAGSLTFASYFTEAFQQTHSFLFSLSVLPSLWIFGIGILCRLFWPRIAPAFEGKGGYWLLGYALLSIVAVYGLGSPSWLAYLPLGPMTILRITAMGLTVIACAFTLPVLSRFLREQDFSYGLYLYHMLVVSILIGFGLRGEAWLWPVVFGGGFVLAAASWFLIEKPALGLKRRLHLSRLRIPPRPVATAPAE